MVVAPHPLMARAVRQPDGPVVAPIARIVAPAVGGPKRPHGQPGARAGQAVRAVEGPEQAEAPGGRGAVAFPLRVRHARASQGAGQRERTRDEDATPRIDRGAMDADKIEGRAVHGRSTGLKPARVVKGPMTGLERVRSVWKT